MKGRIGKIERAARRELISRNGGPATTGDFVRRAWPHLTWFEVWRYRSARRAAKKFAVRIGRAERGKGCPVMWMARPELLRAIRGGPVGATCTQHEE